MNERIQKIAAECDRLSDLMSLIDDRTCRAVLANVALAAATRPNEPIAQAVIRQLEAHAAPHDVRFATSDGRVYRGDAIDADRSDWRDTGLLIALLCMVPTCFYTVDMWYALTDFVTR